MAATIKDIARKLNISISTVSYALNDGPRAVPPEVRQKVLAVAREMEYRPNKTARSMATGRTDTLAIIPPRDAHAMLLSPYLQIVLNGIVEAAEEIGQDVLLRTTFGDADPVSAVQILQSGKADGMFLIAPHDSSQMAEAAAARNFPCVVFSADAPPGALSISIDNREAVHKALDYLVAIGHRRIGHLVGRDGMRDAELRHQAYRDYLRDNDLPVREEWIQYGGFSYQLGREAAERILTLPDRPTALFAANDESGVGAIDAALALGLRVPQDVSIMGFDTLTQGIFAMRGLTSVRQPIHEMAKAGVSLLAQWAREIAMPLPAARTFPAELIVKDTTRAAAKRTVRALKTPGLVAINPVEKKWG